MARTKQGQPQGKQTDHKQTDNQEADDQTQHGATGSHEGRVTAPFWEKAAGALGLGLVLLIIGYLTFEALSPQLPPDILVRQEAVTRTNQGFLVQIRATNVGDQAAASVVVEAILQTPDAAPDAEPVESGEVTFNFVPAGSSRRAGIVFTRNPDEYALDFQVKSFVNP